MGIIKQVGQKSSRKSLKSSASLLGLAAGAVGWSGLAQAASEETTSQMALLPEHYELMENGVVVFKLETGENLSLTSDQYLILEDGLLLITDELAQASIYSLPVMGSVRAQLLSELEQVATIDGTVAEATPAQTLSITEGQAPRLSEQVELQTFELAQASDESSSQGEEALAIGMSVAPGAMALLSMLMTSDQPEELMTSDQPEEEAVVREYLRTWDINPGSGDSEPMNDAVVFNGALYFEATDGTNGKELWTFDGVNPPSMVADIHPSDTSRPRAMTIFDGALYFAADDGTNWKELWKYDGTTATMVADINPIGSALNPNSETLRELIVYGGALYFAADDGSSTGEELWKYDGVNAPTMIADINASGDSNPSGFTVLDGNLYFEAYDPAKSWELWKYDGVNAPTMVTDINPSGGSDIVDLETFNGALYFGADDGTNVGLWKFDPTDTTDSVHGTAVEIVRLVEDNGDEPGANNLTIFNNALYFAGDDGTNGTELWRYDGVNAPSIVKDLNPGSSDGLEYQHFGAPRVYDGALYFAGNDGTGEELWKYDGTNFSRVTDIHPDSNGHADIWDLTVFNGVLYFQADNGQDGRELWAYNADGWVV